MTRPALTAIVVAAAAATAAPPPATAEQPQHTPTVLWKSFPLRKSQPPAHVTTTSRRTHQRQTMTTQPPQQTNGRSWFALAATALGCAAIASFAFLSLSRRRGGDMTKFRLTRNEESDQAQPQVAVPKASGAPSRPADAWRAPAPLTAEDPPNVKPDFDRLGTHVGNVLSAAEEAAARIQQEARVNAGRVREQAEKESAGLVDTARRDAEATKAEAERARAETEEWVEQTRAIAEDYAAEKRGEAEAEAAEIIRRAEQRAVSLRIDAEQRQKALEFDISHSENRLRELVTALHDLADRLDRVLNTQVQHNGEAEVSPESLVDALAPVPTEEAKA
jgi:hypothetical protein